MQRGKRSKGPDIVKAWFLYSDGNYSYQKFNTKKTFREQQRKYKMNTTKGKEVKEDWVLMEGIIEEVRFKRSINGWRT